MNKIKEWEEKVLDTFKQSLKHTASPKQALSKAIETLKEIASCSSQQEREWYLDKYFSVQHHEKALELAMLLREIESKQFAQYEKDCERIEEDKSWIFNEDSDLEDIEIYVEVYSDRLIAVATKPGLGERLPSGMGKKYIGKPDRLQWKYDLKALEVFRQKNILIFGEDNA